MKKVLSIAESAVLILSSLTVNAQELSLNGEWSLKLFPQPSSEAVTTPEAAKAVEGTVIPATVPGNVEIDMLAAGLIEDPMIGNNVYKLRKYEGYQWCYTKTFDSPKLEKDQRAVLEFAGLDTFAEIWLNGKHVGSADNMLIEQEYDITGYLNSVGTNTLEVIIRSSVLEAQKHLIGTISIGNFANEESAYARRAPHTYGWDIMPRLVSAGIWRDVTVKVQNPTRIVDTHWFTSNVNVENRTAEASLHLQIATPFENFDNIKAVVTLTRNGKEFYKSEQLIRKFAQILPFWLNDVDFWWPRGYGEAALYDAKVEIVEIATGKVLATDSERVGFRTVKLDLDDVNLPDKPGRFCFIVNGEPVFAKGTNWVPLDALHSRDKDHVDNAVALMSEMNCNIVRCWGGNVYEDTRFYDLCDENGIMVWQDFAMGCHIYPQGDEFARAIEREAISVVKKFRSHPSLVLWSGNNENDQVVYFGRLRPFKLNPNDDRVSREVLPRVIYEFDPTRPYLPSSPYFSQRVYEAGCGEEVLPEAHLWGPRGYYKADFYAKAGNQFVSEIGYHGCPNRETIEKMFSPDMVYPWINKQPGQWNDEWQTKAVRIYDDKFQGGRNDLMTNQVTLVFGKVPTDLDDFIFASQSVQAEAMKYFVEKWRGDRPNRSGIIWWNIRDGWPILSDAITDYYGGKKIAFTFLKNVHEDVCVIMNDAVDGVYRLIVTNDTLADAEGKVTVKDVKSGKVLYEGVFNSPANAAAQFASIPVQEGWGVFQISYEVNGKKLRNHYVYGDAPYDLNEYRTLIKKAYK